MRPYRLKMLALAGAMLMLPRASHATITYLGQNYEQAIWNTDGGGIGNGTARSFSFPGVASGVTGTAIAHHLSGLSNSLGIIASNVNPTSFTNFPVDTVGPSFDAPYYAPTTFESGRPWLGVSVGRDGPIDSTMMSLTIDLTGNTATQRFIVDFLNLDNASAYFIGAKDINNNTYSGAALKALFSPYLGNNGSPEFEHNSSGTYYMVNATRAAAQNNGLEDSSGNNPNGGGGAILVNLPLKQLTIGFNDLQASSTQGDGFQITLMAVPEPSSIGLALGGLLGMVIARRRRRRR